MGIAEVCYIIMMLVAFWFVIYKLSRPPKRWIDKNKTIKNVRWPE